MSFSAQEAALKRYPSRRPGRAAPCKVHPANSYHRLGRPSVAGVFLLTSLLACGAGGARRGIMIEPRVGFHGVFQLGRPFPFEIELNNTGRPAEGTLEVQVWKGGATKGGAPYLVKYRREFFSRAQTRKTVQLTVDPDFISRPLTIAFSSAEVKACARTRSAPLFFTRAGAAVHERKRRIAAARLDGFAAKPAGVALARRVGGGFARPARRFPSDYLRSIAARVVALSVARPRRLAHGRRQDGRFSAVSTTRFIRSRRLADFCRCASPAPSKSPLYRAPSKANDRCRSPASGRRLPLS